MTERQIETREIIQKIFEKELPIFEGKNSMPTKHSKGYHSKNEAFLRFGLVFKTPTGRNSKVYHYATVSITEDIETGVANAFAAYESTYNELALSIKYFTNREQIKSWIQSYEKIRNKDRQSLTKLVVSVGNGQEMFVIDTFST